MKKNFHLWIWPLVAAGCWSMGFIYNVYIGGFPSWLRTAYARKSELAQAIDQPKLLIAGGSGVHYTINSEILEQELNLPVINLGTNGGIGLNVLLPSVIDLVKPGDILLLMPEYPLLLDNDGLDDLSPVYSLVIGRPKIGGVSTKELAQELFLLGCPSLQALVKTAVDFVQEGRLDYFGDPLDEHGDATIELSRQSEWWKMPIGDPASKYALKQIKKFKTEVERRGGTLVLSLPLVYAESEGETPENIQKTADSFAEIAPTLYDPDTLNIIPSTDMLADTHYHLKIPYRDERSQELAEQLQQAIPQQLPAAK